MRRRANAKCGNLRNNLRAADAITAGIAIALHSGMTLEDIGGEIKTCASAMNSLYGSVVFDEWAVVSIAANKARVLFYTGPRNDEFLKHFVDDLGALRADLLGGKLGAGDFEFSRHAAGTQFEAFLVLAPGIYLLCNNTRESMDTISKNPRWLGAQVPFVELAETIREQPLVLAWDTKFLARA